jgi:hypothetical protein
MGDSVKKYYEMMEERKILSDQGAEPIEIVKYVFVMDYTDGKAYRYNISSLCNKENNWNPDSDSCEEFLHAAGHKLHNCEWMVTKYNDFINGN